MSGVLAILPTAILVRMRVEHDANSQAVGPPRGKRGLTRSGLGGDEKSTAGLLSDQRPTRSGRRRRSKAEQDIPTEAE